MQASWADNGAIIVVPKLADAIPLCDRLAPEHLEFAVDPVEADAPFALVRHAGSVFLGRQPPEAIGDYVAGPDRKSVVSGKSVSVRVDLGGPRHIYKKH